MMNFPSVERVIMPSVDEVAPAVKVWFKPLSAVGIAMLCTSVPFVPYSSRKTSVAAADNAADPVPTR